MLGSVEDDFDLACNKKKELFLGPWATEQTNLWDVPVWHANSFSYGWVFEVDGQDDLAVWFSS